MSIEEKKYTVQFFGGDGGENGGKGFFIDETVVVNNILGRQSISVGFT